MPEIPSLALARLIVKSFLNDDFHPIIVYGDLRMGKSTYALKSLEQALAYLRNRQLLNYDDIRRFMGWDPTEVVEQWLMETERQPCYIWDDAGYWLHSLKWTDPVLVSIQQYMNVVGTDYNTLILTTPDPTWVLSKIANMPGMVRIKIVKRDGSNNMVETRDSKLFSRTAIGYKPWKSPDLKRGGVNKVLIDDFSCKMRQELYDYYQPIRNDYARQAKIQIRDNLSHANRKANLEEMKTMKRLKELEKDLFDGAVNKKVKAIA
jgi:hypothetical protein